MKAALVACIGLAAAATARADRAVPARPPAVLAPDPAVLDAAEANLESTADRRGLTFAGSVGAGLMIGFGIEDSVGRGGAVSLRLGHVATRRTILTFELGVTAALHKPATTSDAVANTSTNLLAGALYYVNRSLWLRAGAGLGGYLGREVLLSNGQRGDLTLIGPAMLGGVGVDLARFKWAVLGIEVATTAMASREGVLVASSLNLGLSFD